MSKLSNEELQLIKLINLTDEELYQNVALMRGRGALGRDPVRQGKELYQKLKTSLQDTICRSDVLKSTHTSTSKNAKASIVAALLDVVSGTLMGVAGASFCVLLINEGLPEYCDQYWR